MKSDDFESGDVVGVDLATNYAIAYGKRGAAPRFMAGTFKSKSHDGRFLEAYGIGTAIAWSVPRLVAIERVPQANRKWKGREDRGLKREVLELLHGYVGALRAGLAINGTRVVLIDAIDARKGFIGSNPARGQAKPATLRACIIRGWLPAGFEDDNVADAMAVHATACALLDKEEGTINGKRILEQFPRKG